MAKRIVPLLFSIGCLVLAVLVAREWTRFYMSGPSESAYTTVYSDKIDAGHHPLTAEVDADTSSFLIWWGGVVTLLVVLPVGGYTWAYRQLWPDATHR